MKKVLCILLVLLFSVTCCAECSHSYGEWEIKDAATESARGVRTRKCSKCGKREYESFYPQGTLYKGISNREADIDSLHAALSELGYDTNMDSCYSEKTAEAVKAFQKAKGFEVTGVAYPQTLNALDVHVDSPLSRTSFKGRLIKDSEGCGFGHYEYAPELIVFCACDRHAGLISVAERFAEAGHDSAVLNFCRQIITDEIAGRDIQGSANLESFDNLIATGTAAEVIEMTKQLLTEVCAF